MQKLHRDIPGSQVSENTKAALSLSLSATTQLSLHFNTISKLIRSIYRRACLFMFSRHKFPFLPASFPAWGTFAFKMLLPSVPRLLLTIPGPDTLGEGAAPGCFWCYPR